MKKIYSISVVCLIWREKVMHSLILWSVTQRKGFLRLTTGRTDTILVTARNTLTQRTLGPENYSTTQQNHPEDMSILTGSESVTFRAG
jgi:hypothetical protein